MEINGIKKKLVQKGCKKGKKEKMETRQTKKKR